MHVRRMLALMLAWFTALALIGLTDVGVANATAPARMPLGLPALPAPLAAVKTGVIKIKITTPKGAPATIRLEGGGAVRVVGKAPSGKSVTQSVVVTAGKYKLRPQIVLSAGRVYAPLKSSISAKVKANRTSKVTVTYRLVATAKDLKVAALTSSGVQLSWSAPKKAKVQLRMRPGLTAPTSVTQGSAVAISGTKATASGLAPGSSYAFGLFTKVSSRWMPPVTVSASTVAAPGSTVATFATAASTVLVSSSENRTVQSSSTGVTVSVPAGIVPVLGQVMVLPVSTGLPGGYVGKVSAISSDGKSVVLTRAAVSDAFVAYKVDIPSFTGDGVALEPAAASKKSVTFTRPSNRSKSTAKNVEPQAISLPGCLEGSVVGKIKLNSPTITPSGSFSFTLDTVNIFGASIPKGAQISSEIKMTTTETIDVDTDADVSCGLVFKPILKTITVDPLPISVYFKPIAEISVNGAMTFSGAGVAVTGGIWAKATMGLTSGASVSGGLIHEATPVTPTTTGIKGSVHVTVGGEVILGPGAGTAEAGAIVGISGQLDVLKGAFGTAFPSGDARFGKCFETTAALAADASLTAKAWLGGWEASAKFPFASGSVPYGGPWYVPSGCNTLPDPGNDLIGDGVTKTSDEVNGSADQWGKSDAFATGSPAWILSTGRVADISGVADDFASTDLGLPGDDSLSALVSGLDTHDAVSYSATLVPSGHSLHVKYLFASEEYPEYVGSEFNDVMAIFVNGTNCALVNGDPISVNTINASTNSSLYIDNNGTKPTSMDGYTTTLQCNVAVTPGVPVKVKIVLADTSDGIYDSAVGLLDKGIWSD